ncbi:alpha/beta hydrolase [Pseudohalocynthiibacter aestuariivivens]|jgi:arylformamidase|uniref:Alpha/beta hydrolase n=1 Tax=Pseudohalocynthiibacter aestuariivivens TaxID=1591409 RepID=A0ABV5JBG6_9RHOB|nr:MULTISPECIES: alpha/beta hydrolase [Pseudohalocynthiibacter]MBS9715655.1 alpha/beta hydrolase [Pseudohalocynthiibacter aestuariivivens]MCK0101268.1 alpha/beta hydrolase [Pseudohalocynthiibacter sp. F2068]
MTDWDDAYANRAYIEDGESYPDRWADEAREWREVEHAIGRARLNISYGAGARELLDLFLPAGRPAGIVVFVHGGYWRDFNKSFWSHLAAGATARDWAVAMPSYTLVPDARISEITAEIARAVHKAAELVAGPIILSGHSAGGHLVARMLCQDIVLSEDVSRRLQRVVPISPLSDLRPLLKTTMNEDFQMDAAEAAAESPVLETNPRDVPVTVWVGGDERPAFLDQAQWLADAWPRAEVVVAPGLHHFNVIEGLADSESSLTNALFALA